MPVFYNGLRIPGFGFRRGELKGSVSCFLLISANQFPAVMETPEVSQLKMIWPPKLEDAGLEDCALPPEAIIEAFLKAASSIKSRAVSMFSADDETEPGDCVENPAPTHAELTHSLIGFSAEPGKSLVGQKKVGYRRVVVVRFWVPRQRKREAERLMLKGYERDDGGVKETPILTEAYV